MRMVEEQRHTEFPKQAGCFAGQLVALKVSSPAPTTVATARRAIRVPIMKERFAIVGAFLGPSPHDSLARRGCGERADGALHTIARPIALLGGDRVGVRRPWFEVIDAHAERRGRMALVQPDGVYSRVAQFLWICTVVHDAVMHVRAPRVVGRPPDDGQVIRGRLELGPFGDFDALGFLGRRKDLRGSRLEREQAADRGRDRECQKQCIHGCSRPWRTRDETIRLASAVERLATRELASWGTALRRRSPMHTAEAAAWG